MRPTLSAVYGMRMWPAYVLGLSGLMATLACQPSPAELDTRARWLRDQLLADNRDLMEREPELTAGKYIKMASSPYNYFRGTAAITMRDVLAAGPYATPSSHLSPEVMGVLLVGDPHPENFGTFLDAQGRMVIDLNDLDASTFGPYTLDVRRLALGFWVMGHQGVLLGVMDPSQRDALAQASARGYAQQIAAMSRGQLGVTQAFERGQGRRLAGAVFADLIRRAERDGDAREELLEYTQLDAQGRRVMRYGTIEASDDPRLYGDEVIPASKKHQDMVISGLMAYGQTTFKPKSSQMLRLKGISRRLGAGVSSYPVLRLYALIEGPTDGPDDDVLLELKEILDPALMPGVTLYGTRQAKSQAERVVRFQRALQHSPEVDPWLGYLHTPPWSLRVRERAKHQKGADVSRILSELGQGELTQDDVTRFAQDAGAILAAAHGRAQTLQGVAGASVIAAAIGPEQTAFIDETTRFAQTYGPVVIEDHQRLQALLDAYGPTLGYRPITSGAPR